jgi:hypothetical protein
MDIMEQDIRLWKFPVMANTSITQRNTLDNIHLMNCDYPLCISRQKLLNVLKW